MYEIGMHGHLELEADGRYGDTLDELIDYLIRLRDEGAEGFPVKLASVRLRIYFDLPDGLCDGPFTLSDPVIRDVKENGKWARLTDETWPENQRRSRRAMADLLDKLNKDVNRSA